MSLHAFREVSILERKGTRGAAHSSRKAFTLTELLIVIAIIGILIGIIMPAVGGVQRAMRSMKCQTNLKTLHLAFVSFANDHKGQYPFPTVRNDGYTDPNILANGAFPIVQDSVVKPDVGRFWKYVASAIDSRLSIVWCPSDSGEEEKTGSGSKAADRNFSYSFNWKMRDTVNGQLAGINRQRVLYPMERIMIYEEIGPNDFWGVLRPKSDPNNDDRPSGRHGNIKGPDLAYGSDGYINRGQCNVMFFDGHVEAMPPEDINNNSNYYDPFK
jgi:prepilin-type N-terminal cleavage/methylation domain-containing protein/prepilin-type processing-associated H-X9-DG protein